MEKNRINQINEAINNYSPKEIIEEAFALPQGWERVKSDLRNAIDDALANLTDILQNGDENYTFKEYQKLYKQLDKAEAELNKAFNKIP